MQRWQRRGPTTLCNNPSPNQVVMMMISKMVLRTMMMMMMMIIIIITDNSQASPLPAGHGCPQTGKSPFPTSPQPLAMAGHLSVSSAPQCASSTSSTWPGRLGPSWTGPWGLQSGARRRDGHLPGGWPGLSGHRDGYKRRIPGWLPWRRRGQPGPPFLSRPATT